MVEDSISCIFGRYTILLFKIIQGANIHESWKILALFRQPNFHNSMIRKITNEMKNVEKSLIS